MFAKGRVIKGSLVVVNSGATEAKIIESRYKFYWSISGLPMTPPLEDEETTVLLHYGDTIDGYGSCIIPVESRSPLSGDPKINPTGGGQRIYVMGFIRYSDWDLKERLMGFCREYVPSKHAISLGEGRFEAVTHSDYEYQD